MLIWLFPSFSHPQLNQQNQTKGATSQDYSFLKEVSPIYVTSLTGNHVSGTTTLTTGIVTNLGGVGHYLTGSNQLQTTAVVYQNNNTATTVTPPVTVVSGQQVLVHQPPSLSNKTAQQQPYQNHTAGGWLLGESAKGTIISNAHPYQQNLNTINNNNIGGGGGTIIAAAAVGATVSVDSNLGKYYGNNTTTGGNNELLANGGPRREVN